MKSQAILTTFALGVTILISGCSSKDTAITNSGFFEDYKQFAKTNKTKANLSTYKNIIVAPVQIISYIPQIEQTIEQKKLYQEISDYLNAEYELIIDENPKYSLIGKNTPDTLVLESAISAVEVHPDDKAWNPHTPIPMGLNVLSFNAYIEEDVRILGEMRLVDSKSNEVISNSMNIQDTTKIMLDGDVLTFKDIQPALDSFLEQIKEKLK